MAGDTATLALGNAIKLIQRGTITIADTATTGTATITSVDTTKSELRMLGASPTSSTGANNVPYIQLTNATTITATRAGTTGVVVVSWELTEFY